MMLGEIESVPSELIKNLCIIGLAVVGAAYYVKGLLRNDDKPTTTQIDPQPVQVQKVFPSATIKDLSDKHDEHGRRLDAHDREITSLWNTMRNEDKEIRAEMAAEYKAISHALGRIEGHLQRHAGDEGD